MRRVKFDDECPLCRPAIYDSAAGRILSDDSPIMQKVNAEWAKTTVEQRAAFHRIACLDSRNVEDAQAVEPFVQALRKVIPDLQDSIEERPPTATKSRPPAQGHFDIRPLIDELVAMTKACKIKGFERSTFLDEKNKKRVRDIGEFFHALGGFELMRLAHESLLVCLLDEAGGESPQAFGDARELEYAWDGIGEWLG